MPNFISLSISFHFSERNFIAAHVVSKSIINTRHRNKFETVCTVLKQCHGMPLSYNSSKLFSSCLFLVIYHEIVIPVHMVLKPIIGLTYFSELTKNTYCIGNDITGCYYFTITLYISQFVQLLSFFHKTILHQPTQYQNQ